MNDEKISIGKVSKLLGVHVDTLRDWEKNGRLIPAKTAGNHRRYSMSQINPFLGIQMRTVYDEVSKSRQAVRVSDTDTVDSVTKRIWFFTEEFPEWGEKSKAQVKLNGKELVLEYSLPFTGSPSYFDLFTTGCSMGTGDTAVRQNGYFVIHRNIYNDDVHAANAAIDGEISRLKSNLELVKKDLERQKKSLLDWITNQVDERQKNLKKAREMAEILNSQK